MSLELLTFKINELNTSFTLWNRIVLFLMFFTAFIAVLYFIASYIANAKAVALNKAKDELIQLKDKEQALQIASLNTEAEKAKQGIAIANQKAAEANEKAEAEQLARLQLEARLAPRTLTEEQQTRLTSLLSPFSGTEVDVITFGDTSEIGNISMTILRCLQNATWEVYPAKAMGSSAVVTGILVGVRPNTDATIGNAAKTLILALQSVGINASSWDFNQMPYPSVTVGTPRKGNAPIKIFVGGKW
jgi:hypothetical protein